MFIREKREGERGNEKETVIERENERDERRKRSRDCIGIISTLVHCTNIKWSMKLSQYNISFSTFIFFLFTFR